LLYPNGLLHFIVLFTLFNDLSFIALNDFSLITFNDFIIIIFK
jgi:hypothetical protein